jgi:putative ABC transport system permease protein
MPQRRFSRMLAAESFGADLRHTIRQICKAPAFSASVVLVLAAGFGISVAVFSVVRNVLLSPLPYNEPDRLIQIVSWWPKTGDQTHWSAPLRDAVDWKSSVPALQDLAIYRYNLANLTGSGPAEPSYGLRVSANLMPMLGVRPQIGSWFSAEYDRPGSAHVIMLSDDLWRSRFHADRNIVGKTIHLDSVGYEVAAVMPRGFNFPLKLGTNALLPTDQMQYWVPLPIDLEQEGRGNPNAGVIARLKPGVSLAEAQSQLDAACLRLQQEFPATNRGLSAHPSSLREQTVRQTNTPLLALLAATGLTVLLTCANIASLLLARGESKSAELAIRMALGGTVSRIARLPILQSILLCGGGGFLGIPFAIASVHVLLRLAPVDVPRLANASIDWKAVLFAVGLALGSGLFIGALNALQVLKRSPRNILTATSRTHAGRPRTRLRSSLVVSQVALAVILFSGTGLMLRTFLNLLSSDTGFEAKDVFYGVTVLPHTQYAQFEKRQLFFNRVLARLRSTPHVESAAVSTGFPFVGQYDDAKAQSTELATGNRDSGVSADFNAVSAGYLETMGVRLLRGRFVSETDTASTPKVAVIDENLARALWPGNDPLGRSINTSDPQHPVWRQVVGVVAPMRNVSLDLVARAGVFVPLDQTTGNVNFVVIKSTLAPNQAAQLLKNAVANVDPNQGVFFFQSLQSLVSDTIAVRRFLLVTLAFFAVAALVLSTLGIYGLISFIAISRTREVGIRIALGATKANIGRLIVSEGLRLTLLGVGAGVLLSAAVGLFLSSLLFGVRSFDVETVALTIAVLGLASIIAALIPALRSTRVQPMTALRAE